MSHIYSVFHIVFSTKKRKLFLKQGRSEIISYIAGICQNKGMTLIKGKAMPDHVHLLVSIPSSMSLAKAIGAIKSNSSSWAKREIYDLFSWQPEYGAFSVSKSNVPQVVQYIERQEKHHTDWPFELEYEQFLEKHDIDFGKDRLWG